MHHKRNLIIAVRFYFLFATFFARSIKMFEISFPNARIYLNLAASSNWEYNMPHCRLTITDLSTFYI